MLVLSRKLQEEIVIPSLDIRLKVVGISSGRVRVGIEAPPKIEVNRLEIHRNTPASQTEGWSER